MDTFLVRTLLVPSTAVLLGRWNWWPSRMSRPGAGPAAPAPSPVPAATPRLAEPAAGAGAAAESIQPETLP